MVERRRTSVRGYIPAEAIRPDAGIDFVLRRRGPARPRIETELREKMDEYAAGQGILGSMIEYIVHYQLGRRRLVDGVHFDFQCLAGHHRVLTSGLQWIPISDVMPGDELLAFDENGPRRDWKTTCVISNKRKPKPSYLVTLSDGTEIIASEDHLWLGWPESDRIYGWVQTRALKVGSEVPKLFEPWTRRSSWEGGYLAGMFDGEGTLCQSEQTHHAGFCTRLAIFQRENHALRRTLAALENQGIPFTTYDHDTCRDGRVYSGVIEIRILGGKNNILKTLGLFAPPRLIQKLDGNRLGKIQKSYKVVVEGVKDVGEQPVYTLGTECRTFVAEGFPMHNSSLFGGRIELGGAVVDFLFRDRPLAVRVMGTYWHPAWQSMGLGANDEEQRLVLEAYGWTVEDLFEDVVMDNDRLEDWMVRKIDTVVVRGMWTA